LKPLNFVSEPIKVGWKTQDGRAIRPLFQTVCTRPNERIRGWQIVTATPADQPNSLKPRLSFPGVLVYFIAPI